jgi:Domain of unknown function (DUF4167)
MIKRQRGRGRNPGQKPQNNNPNRAYESNGPDLKVRGSAQTVFEKYQQLGRDAMSNGDRVLGENYMQHAEHYYRMLRAMQPNFVPRTELMIAGYEDDYEDGEGGNAPVDGEAGEGGEGVDAQNGAPQPDFQQNRGPRDRDNREYRDNRDRNRDRPQRDFQQNREPRDPNEPRAEGEDDRFGGRRRRRERFGGEGSFQNNGQNGENSQGEARPRRDFRPEFRGERPEGQGERDAPREAPQEFAQPDLVQTSNPQEIIAASEGDAPARERRPRPPRAPRAPRVAAPEAETGFGNELPAFLAASVPVTSSE